MAHLEQSLLVHLRTPPLDGGVADGAGDAAAAAAGVTQGRRWGIPVAGPVKRSPG